MDLYGPEKVIGIVPRDGFETSLALDASTRFARAAALDADWNVLASSGIVDVSSKRVFGDVPPVTEVKHTGSVIFTDGEGGYEGYAISVTHSDFPLEGSVFGVQIGWHTGLGCLLLVGLWIAAKHV